MLIKFLATISILFNPFTFLFSQFDVDLEQKADPLPAELPISTSLTADFNFNPSLANAISSIIISTAKENNPNFLPIRNWNVSQPEIEAKAALISMVSSVEPFEPEKNKPSNAFQKKMVPGKILYQKNIEQVLPIASLTKLMTGLIVLENINLDQIVTVTKEAIGAYGDMGGLVVNEKISVKNLLYALLMESSNDAAVSLADAFGDSSKDCPLDTVLESRAVSKGQSLVLLMNKKAEELELENTHFIEPSGYNPANLSTALDLAELVKYSLDKPVIWQILKTSSIDLLSADGVINHHFTNTNQLLNNRPAIVGGKTGYTNEAQGCMILVIEQNLNKIRNYIGQPSSEYLIIIVLGTQERFSETEKLINWVKEAYIW